MDSDLRPLALPTTIITKLNAYQDELGLPVVVVQTGWESMAVEQRLDTVRPFAENVMPAFTATHSLTTGA